MQWSVAIVINRIDPRSVVDEELDCELNTMHPMSNSNNTNGQYRCVQCGSMPLNKCHK
jgi:hypothetical protein